MTDSANIETFNDQQYIFVDTKEQFEELKWQYELNTKSHFVSVKTSKSFGNTDVNKKQHKIQWKHQDPEFPDHPYIVLNDERYECHHGPDRNKAKKNKPKVEKQLTDHQYEKRRFHVQPSKKMNCPASIIAKEILIFTEFKASVSNWKREQITKIVKESLKSDLKEITIKTERRIIVKLPLNDEHKFHLLGEVEEISMPVDKQVISKIEEYVREGFVSVSTVRPLLEYFVRKEIFACKPCPPWTNRRFFPSQRDIANIIYQARFKALKSKYDQENLLATLSDWTRERPEDLFYFEPCTPEDEVEGTGKSAFFFMYQSEWQKRLLRRYGNDLCFMDATYRTTKYAIPLFFICVKTNVDYSVVAVFASQSEDSKTVELAINKLKEWNPCWEPQFFMVDYCEAEINGIRNSFPDCKVFICDFHGEQAWNRWIKASKHNVNNSAEDVKSIMKRAARALTIADYQDAIKDLQSSRIWKTNKQLRDWFTSTWLNKAEMWAWVYRQERLNVKINTNNGIERQNRTFKYDFLSKYTDRTLTGMLSTVIQRYLPDQYRNYMQHNIKSSSLYRSYSTQLPEFLHNRPKEFVDHCRKRIPNMEEITGKLANSGTNTYSVMSFSNANKIYKVHLGNEDTIPSCQCFDWMHTHWPCKHMLAVIMYQPGCSWNDIPEHYKDNPFFTLDECCIQELQPLECPKISTEVEDVEQTILDEAVSGDVTEDIPHTQNILQAIREELDQIRSCSYLNLPSDVLLEAYTELLSIREKLHRALPKENNIPLINAHQTVKLVSDAPFGITKRKFKSKVKNKLGKKDVKQFGNLPLRKKRKVSAEQNVNIINEPNISDNANDVIVCRRRKTKSSITDVAAKRRRPETKSQDKPDELHAKTSKNTLFNQNELIVKLKAHMDTLTTDQWKGVATKGITAIQGMRAAAAIEHAKLEEDQLISVIKSYIPFSVEDSTLVTIIFNLISALVDNGDVKLKTEDDPSETARKNREATKDLVRSMSKLTETKEDAASENDIENGIAQKSILKTEKKDFNTADKKKKTVTFQLDDVTDCAPVQQSKELFNNDCDVILQKNWNKRTPSDYIVAKVYGVNVTDRDVLSLKGNRWLTDQIVDAYLGYLSQSYIDQGGNILHILSRTLTAILNGEYNASGSILQKTKLLRKKTILWAYLQGSSHWDLVVIEPFRGKIYFYNPMGETRALCKSILNNWSLFMNARKLKQMEKDKATWALETPKHSKQTDSSNCGVYTLMFAERNLYQKSCENITKEEVKSMRKKIGLDLLQFSGQLQNCCRCCAWTLKEDEETITCEQCRYVFH